MRPGVQFLGAEKQIYIHLLLTFLQPISITYQLQHEKHENLEGCWSWILNSLPSLLSTLGPQYDVLFCSTYTNFLRDLVIPIVC